MAARWSSDRLATEVAVLAGRALPRDDFFRELAARLRRTVDFDAACWHTLDPETRLLTSDAPHELVEAGLLTWETAPTAGATLVASEYLVEDVNTFATLARRREPVGILTEATRARPERSARYRDLLMPLEIPFELRAAFVSRGRAWGAVHFARRSGRSDFSRADASVLARISGTIADGLRASVRFDAARRAESEHGPGLLVLGPANEIELITPPARALMDALRGGDEQESGEVPPAALLALASFVRAYPSDLDPSARAVAVPASSGWMTLHASLPEGRGGGRVAVVLERASTPETTALRLEAHGVTAREREVAVMLARGLANPAIAEALVISPYTVQDHIKSLFEKTGVSSRHELVARMFLEGYLPHIARHAPLSSSGGFAE